MTHADLDDLAALVLDPDDASDELRSHVASCPDCGALLASLADVRRVAGEGELVPAPDRVREQVLSHVRSPAAPDPSTTRPTTRTPVRSRCRSTHRHGPRVAGPDARSPPGPPASPPGSPWSRASAWAD